MERDTIVYDRNTERALKFIGIFVMVVASPFWVPLYVIHWLTLRARKTDSNKKKNKT